MFLIDVKEEFFSCCFNDHLQSTSNLIKTNRQISVQPFNVSKIELNLI